MFKLVYLLLLIVSTNLFTGCASIMNSGKENLVIKSTPPEANFTIIDKANNSIIFEGKTPATVVLEKKEASRGKEYLVRIDKTDFLTQEVTVDSRVSAWFYGNVVLGGIIGIIVDTTTGNIWTLDKNEINVTLDPVLKQSIFQNNRLYLPNETGYLSLFH